MSNAHKIRARAQPLVVAGDFGPVLARVVVEDAPDPDAPNRTVRRARVRCNYDTLWKRGGLTDGEREAADRYAQLCEAEAGARDRPAAGMPAGGQPWQHGGPSDRQVQASADLRRLHKLVGMDGAALLRLYVRDGLPVPEIAKRRREDERQTLGRTRAALGRLAEHWGM